MPSASGPAFLLRQVAGAWRLMAKAAPASGFFVTDGLPCGKSMPGSGCPELEGSLAGVARHHPDEPGGTPNRPPAAQVAF